MRKRKHEPTILSLAKMDEVREHVGSVVVELFGDGSADVQVGCAPDEQDGMLIRALFALTQASDGLVEWDGDGDA